MADAGRHWKFREEAPRSGLDREGCGETKGPEPGSKGRAVFLGVEEGPVYMATGGGAGLRKALWETVSG